MGYKVGFKDADRIFGQLQDEYEIWAPKRFVGKGRYSDTDLIKYAQVASVKEIEYKEKSDFPAKEVLSPITLATWAYLIRSVSEYLPFPTNRLGAQISYSS